MTSSNVFVLNTHAKHGLVAVRNLGKHGLRVTAGSCNRWNVGGMSKYASRSLRMPDPVAESDAFVDAVEDELRARPYDMLLPINEPTTELVVRHRDRFEPDTAIPMGPYEKMLVGIDKGKTVEAAREFDIPHPTTMLPGEVEFDDVDATLGYPVVVKPHRGSSREGVSVCHSRDELESVYRETTAEHGPTQLQEFVPHGGERGVYTFYDRTSTLAGVTVQERIRSDPPEGGASTYRETVHDPALVELTDGLLGALEWVGVAMAEYRIDPRDGEPKLLEINPRLWGSLVLSIFAGVEFPWLLFLLAIDEPIPVDLEYRVGVRARCLFTDLRQVSHRPDTLRAVREYLTPSSKPTCHDIVSVRDPLPTVGECLYLLHFLKSSIGAPGTA